MKNLTLPALKQLLSTLNAKLIIAIQISAFVPQLRFVAYVLIIIFIARLIPMRDNMFTRLALAFGLTTAAIGFIALVSWFLNTPLTAWVILSLINLGLIALTLGIRQPAYGLRTNAHDLAAALIGLATILFILWPFLQHPEGQTLAKIIATGGDNTAHIEMMKADDLNQGVAYGLHNRVNPIVNAVNYPQNWHFNLAFLKWTTEPLVNYTSSPSSLLMLFYGFSALWLGLLMFFIARISLMIVEDLPVKKHNMALIGVVAVCSGVFLHWLLQLFTFGFQAQLAASVLLLLELACIIEAFKSKPAHRHVFLLLATILAVALNSTWTFLSPLAAVLLAAAIIITLVQARSWGPRYFIFSMIGLGLLATLQPLFYKLFPVTYEFPALLQRGYTQETYLFALILLFIIAVLYMVLRWRNKPLRIVLALSTGALLFSLWLFAYHLSAVGELRYFYYKATYTFIILTAISFAAIAYELIAMVLRQRAYLPRKAHAVVLGVLVVGIAGMLCWQVKTGEVDTLVLGQSAGIDNSQADYLLDAMHSDPINGYYDVFIGSCNRGNDIRATQMFHALAFADPKPHNHIFFDPGKHEETQVFESIAVAAQRADRLITVFSNDQVLTAKLRTHLGDLLGKVKIVEMDATPETEPIHQCPDRIRDTTTFPA